MSSYSRFTFGLLSIFVFAICILIIPAQKAVAGEITEAKPMSIYELWYRFKEDYYWIDKEENAWMKNYETFKDAI